LEAPLNSFWLAAPADPMRIALVAPEPREVSAGELFAACNQVVHGLRARGLGEGSTVAVLLPNGAEMLEVYLAAMQAGWYITPLNTHLVPAEIAYVLADARVDALVAHARFGDKAAAAARLAGTALAQRFAVGGAIAGFEDYAALKAGQPRSRPEARRGGQLLQYTSGTTGRPKGVRRKLEPIDPDVQAHAYSAQLGRFDIEPGRDGVHLCGSPMYHLAALSYALFSLHWSHKVVLMDKWSAEECLALIERHRVTTTQMVPTQFHRLLQLPPEVRARHDVSSLRQVLHAAAPCPVDVKRRMLEWWGPVIYEYYGASEGGGTLVKPHEWLERPGTVGRAWEGAEVRIYDDAGRQLGPGEIGNVYMKVMGDFEYGGDPEKTRAARIGSFFTAGDVGWLDADGYLFLSDRKIDMIISGGVNIYPAEIEAALLRHPAVGDAAVFGIPDPDWGEQVKAVVEPAAGFEASPALGEQLMTHCRESLAGYKCPRSIDFVDRLPRDPNGKLYKRTLRDPYWAGRERKI
jgi:long-chain acyl-CoA synthetase